MKDSDLRKLKELQQYPLVQALLTRRSRRFFMSAEIPDGVFKYKSKQQPFPLSELEKLLVVGACGGATAWHYMIYRADRYAPKLANYAGAAAGRIFPSAAGFHTSKTFFTDDDGVYVLDNRDAPIEFAIPEDGAAGLDAVLEACRSRIKKLEDGRLRLPPKVPFVEAHNTWVVNHPSTLLVIPVGDLAQHVLLAVCYMLQNGLVITDDINRRALPGIEQFRDIVDVSNTWPLTFVEQLCMAELTAELVCGCYAGVLMLQAMGLGGWMFDGVDPFAMLGASGDPEAPGLGFRYDKNENWPYPNPTGKDGVMTAMCPPHVKDMRSAVDLICERKFGPGGPFNPGTPGPWKDSPRVRSSAEVHSERFRECAAFQAQYILDTFGKFPGTVPSIYTIQYLQAHHLDLDFYDAFYKPGAYSPMHAAHMQTWHADEELAP